MGTRGANSDDWRESLALCLLCAPTPTPLPAFQFQLHQLAPTNTHIHSHHHTPHTHTRQIVMIRELFSDNHPLLWSSISLILSCNNLQCIQLSPLRHVQDSPTPHAHNSNLHKCFFPLYSTVQFTAYLTRDFLAY